MSRFDRPFVWRLALAVPAGLALIAVFVGTTVVTVALLG
jgi:hypothetical protein